MPSCFFSPWFLLLALLAPPPGTGRSGAQRVTLTVVVTGATQTGGRIGVAVFGSADGFPEDQDRAQQRVERPRAAAVDSFVFRDLAPGRYAIAAYHDANGNGKLDKNLFGAPRESWGSSGTVRPRMRAPRFDEAAVELTADARVMIEVKR